MTSILGCLLFIYVFNYSSAQFINNMARQQIRVSTVHLPPLMVIKKEANGSSHFAGPLFQQLEWLSRRLQFKYVLHQQAENMIGTEVNGSWNGLIGQLIRQETDLALFPFTINHERYRVIAFAGLFAGGTNVLLSRYPTAQISSGAVLEPLDTQVWIGWLVCFTIVTVVAIIFVSRCLQRGNQNEPGPRAGTMFFYTLGTITAQGGFCKMTHASLCILAATWCFAAFVFVNVYCTTLTSKLATDYSSPEINSVRQLAESSYKVVVIKGSTAEADIKAATSGPLKLIRFKLLACPECSTHFVEEVGRRVLHERFIGFQASSTSLGLMQSTFQTSKRICQLTLASETMTWMHFYFGTPKTSSFAEEINRESLWTHAHGFPLKWGSYGPIDNPCLLKYNRKGVEVRTFNRPLKLRQLDVAFVILLCGYVLAFICFLGERYQICSA